MGTEVAGAVLMALILLLIVLAVVGGMIYGAAGLIAGAESARRLRLLSRARRADTRERFVRGMASAGAPIRVAEETFRYVAEDLGGTPYYPVYPTDSLSDIYGVGRAFGTELEDVLREVTIRCGVPIQVSQVKWPPIVTVRDLVLAVAAVYRQEMANRETGHLLRPADAPPDYDALLRPAKAVDAAALVRPAESPTDDGADR